MYSMWLTVSRACACHSVNFCLLCVVIFSTCCMLCFTVLCLLYLLWMNLCTMHAVLALLSCRWFTEKHKKIQVDASHGQTWWVCRQCRRCLQATMSLTLPHIALTVVCSLMASCLLHILLALADDLLIFITMLVRTASRFLLKSSVTKRIGHSDSLQMMHDIKCNIQICMSRSHCHMCDSLSHTDDGRSMFSSAVWHVAIYWWISVECCKWRCNSINESEFEFNKIRN